MPKRRHNLSPRGGYVLLETVIATGLLVLGLAVLGSQVQGADKSIRRMDLRMRALMLAEMQLAHLDTGLIEINSVDDIEEEEFGPRYPSFGWRLITDETRTEDLYRLTLEILYARRDDFELDEFDFDVAEVLYTFHVFRARPKPLSFSEDFGLREEEVTEIADKLKELGIPGLDPEEFDPTIFARLETDQLMQALPVLMDAFGMDPTELIGSLPPDVQEALRGSGLLDDVMGAADEQGAAAGGDSNKR